MHLTAADRALAAQFDGPLERNSQVHPALQPFVNSIAPAPQPLRRYMVTVGKRDQPRMRFEAMGRDSFAVREQHDSLREPGERIEVEPILSAAEQWHVRNDAAALQRQCDAQMRSEWSARS